MPRYAQYDSSKPSPSPVTGWYDTTEFNYPNLPPAEDLIEMNEQQWAVHFIDPHGWLVENGNLQSAND